MSRWLIVVAVLAILVGMGFIMPAVAKLNEMGVAVHLLPYTLGMLMTVAGVTMIVRVSRRKNFPA
jgi:hypothetical protein